MTVSALQQIKKLVLKARQMLSSDHLSIQQLENVTASLLLERDRLRATLAILEGKGAPTDSELARIGRTYAKVRHGMNPFTGATTTYYFCGICGPKLLPRLLLEVERIAAKCESRLQRLRQSERKTQQLVAKAASSDGMSRKLASRLKRRLERPDECPYCGGPLGDDCCADHIWPVCRGGLSDDSNLVFVCANCNRAKRDLTLREFALAAHLDRSAIEARLAALGKRF